MDILLGETQTFVGHTYQNTLIGGSGLKIDFKSENSAAEGARPVIVQVNWGDNTPSGQSSFNPTFQSVFRTPTGSSPVWTDSIILPHIYSNVGQFTVIVQLLEAPLPGQQPVLQAQAQIEVSVGHVISGSQGLFLRGSTVADTVNISPSNQGLTQVTAQFDTVQVDLLTDKVDVYVETLSGADQIIASPDYDNRLFADGGNDDDVIRGGSGTSQILGGPGNDVLSAGDGRAEIFGAAGDDSIYGGIFDDVLDGGTGSDSIYGNEGDDLIYGDEGSDLIEGGEGSDQIIGGLGADSISGGAGDDILIAGYINVATPNFPAGMIFAAWTGYDIHGISRIVKSKIIQPPTDLSAVPFLITADGRTKTPRMTFGSLIANDGAVDILNGGAGRNAVVANFAAPKTSDIVVKIPRIEGVNSIVRLTDHALATVRTIAPLTSYITSNGADIVNNPTRGTYLLNRTFPDGNNLIAALNFRNGVSSTEFRSFYGKPAQALYRILNLSDFAKFSNPIDIFWANFNRPFMGYGIAFGGVFMATSDPFDPKNLYSEKDGSPSPSLREQRYLFKTVIELYPTPDNPYTYDPLRRLYYQPIFA